ncbi:hypothetical protein SISSUDRAFT_182337 [Sistotremastrum suecicum HHB10207 ss-3]|uniref:Uncharacterized protein n=1 Tax=Sistotremastrum suecicum HHB10207 ss-3 TaxID=1314776 RepID=A0A166GT54_9AGAM|nr:hypothetical protein SISSUDRAFT_182337 [Sistotremastrum suecicum HHB10207 ss-3]
MLSNDIELRFDISNVGSLILVETISVLLCVYCTVMRTVAYSILSLVLFISLVQGGLNPAKRSPEVVCLCPGNEHDGPCTSDQLSNGCFNDAELR